MGVWGQEEEEKMERDCERRADLRPSAVGLFFGILFVIFLLCCIRTGSGILTVSGRGCKNMRTQYVTPHFIDLI